VNFLIEFIGVFFSLFGDFFSENHLICSKKIQKYCNSAKVCTQNKGWWGTLN
jgi:hypothetical protein